VPFELTLQSYLCQTNPPPPASADSVDGARFVYREPGAVRIAEFSAALQQVSGVCEREYKRGGGVCCLMFTRVTRSHC
jgi:hypothetical protein